MLPSADGPSTCAKCQGIITPKLMNTAILVFPLNVAPLIPFPNESYLWGGIVYIAHLPCLWEAGEGCQTGRQKCRERKYFKETEDNAVEAGTQIPQRCLRRVSLVSPLPPVRPRPPLWVWHYRFWGQKTKLSPWNHRHMPVLGRIKWGQPSALPSYKSTCGCRYCLKRRTVLSNL